MDHAGHSQPPPLLNQPLKLLKELFTVSLNNNWSTAVEPKDSNVKDATVLGQNGLSTTLTMLVLFLKVNMPTLLKEEPVKLPQLPENSLTALSHGQCSVEMTALKTPLPPPVQFQSVLMLPTGVYTRAEFSATVDQPLSTTLLPLSDIKLITHGSLETRGELHGENKDSLELPAPEDHVDLETTL